jgi:glycosyltransferase involved in cell wall biosynthesis
VRMIGDLVAQTTVVIAVWDEYAGQRLTEALHSLEQQGSGSPIVLVDNASQVAIPEPLGVTVVRSARRLTLGAARNLGLEHVVTPYVVVWDADDVMLPGTLLFLESAISADSGVAAFGSTILEDPSGTRHRWPRPRIASFAAHQRAFAVLNAVWSQYPATGATIMRTAAVRSAHGYPDVDSGEDWCLGVSLAFRGRIGWSERPGRIYRVHDESVWARHMSARHQLRHAHAVRQRLRDDTAIPTWARAMLPLICLGQYVAIGAHAMLDAARRFSGGRRRASR